MLIIKDLQVIIEDKKIIKGLSLELEQGKVHILMGPNGSGKSTLAKSVMGYPGVHITQGSITLNNENILDMKTHERAKKGLFLGFQNPIPIPGVNIMNLLRTSYNEIHVTKMSIFDFKTFIETKSTLLGIKKSFLTRSLNEGFSGGEKKKAELLQLLVLNPKVAILDEPDSGLDIDALKDIAKGINTFMTPKKTVLIITHYKRIIDYINADKVFIMKEGKIVKEGDKSLVEELEKKGYALIQ